MNWVQGRAASFYPTILTVGLIALLVPAPSANAETDPNRLSSTPYWQPIRKESISEELKNDIKRKMSRKGVDYELTDDSYQSRDGSTVDVVIRILPSKKSSTLRSSDGLRIDPGEEDQIRKENSGYDDESSRKTSYSGSHTEESREGGLGYNRSFRSQAVPSSPDGGTSNRPSEEGTTGEIARERKEISTKESSGKDPSIEEKNPQSNTRNSFSNSIRIAVYADPSYRKGHPGWKEDIKYLVQMVSDRFYKAMGAPLEMVSCQPSETNFVGPPPYGLRPHLVSIAPRPSDPVDIKVGFTEQTEEIARNALGYSNMWIPPLVARAGEFPSSLVSANHHSEGDHAEYDAHVLQHELTHALGEHHTYKPTPSNVMSTRLGSEGSYSSEKEALDNMHGRTNWLPDQIRCMKDTVKTWHSMESDDAQFCAVRYKRVVGENNRIVREDNEKVKRDSEYHQSR
ncbi:hypothetical protein [Pasteuria penetrans]|uniref:hypothetical protein n=1 Tax=Pasteuria penetrans TaxID=86005 RepID=UPI000FBDD741|nr:hypothetical protein [Pasteuria penetrans]